MALDIWIAVAILLFTMLLISIFWSVYREYHFSRVTSRLGRGIASLPKAMQQVEQSLDKMTVQLNRHCDDTREKQSDLIGSLSETKRLVLDVERRLSEIIRDTRTEPSQYNDLRTNSHFGKHEPEHSSVIINTHAYGPNQQNIGQEGGEAGVDLGRGWERNPPKHDDKDKTEKD